MDLRPPKAILAEIKAATGLSDPKLATRIGISQSMVHRILNDGQRDCSGKTLRLILIAHAEVMAEQVA